MTDARMLWFDFGGDIGIGSDMDLLRDDGLYTAIMISLFSDARAPLDVVLPQDQEDRRGWWNDSLAASNVGSLLWTLRREKTTDETAARAKEYCQNALQWLIDNDIASNLVIETQIVPPVGLQIEVVIQRGKSKEYDYLWQGVRDSVSVEIENTSIKLQFV